MTDMQGLFHLEYAAAKRAASLSKCSDRSLILKRYQKKLHKISRIICATIFVQFFCFLRYIILKSNSVGFVKSILNFIQQFIPPFASWWIVLVFYAFVEDEGAEEMFSCAYSRKILGVGLEELVLTNG